MKIEELKEENKKIRDSLDGYLAFKKEENDRSWELINELIENEIEQEKLCNQ